MDTTMQFFKPDDELNNLIHFATENYKRAVKESPNVSARSSVWSSRADDWRAD